MHANIYIDGQYWRRNPSMHSEDSPWKAGQVIKMLTIMKIQPTTVCEIGCGAGDILVELYRQLASTTKFTGYDVSEEAIHICKTKEQKRLKFNLADPLENRTFFYDLVLSIDVMEHVENYMVFLRNIKGLGKHKLFHIPLEISVQTAMRCRPFMRSRQQYGHLHFFTKETALSALIETGHKIEFCFFTPCGLELPNRNIISKLMEIPRGIVSYFNPNLSQRLFGGYSLMVLTT